MDKDIVAVAMRLLAGREHSQVELIRKLVQRGYALAQARATVEQLAKQRLQSDDRFIESFIHSRRVRGYGPVRIELELRQRGYSETEIASYLNETDSQWVLQAKAVRVKKFGQEMPVEFSARAKQQRFLEYRGFSPEQIRQIMDTADEIA